MANSEDEIVELRTISTTTPRREGHKHRLESKYFNALLIVAVVTTIAILGVVLYNVIYGSADAQRLSYGILGTALGLLWGEAARAAGR